MSACWALGLFLCYGSTQRKQISSLHIYEEVIPAPRASSFRLQSLASEIWSLHPPPRGHLHAPLAVLTHGQSCLDCCTRVSMADSHEVDGQHHLHSENPALSSLSNWDINLTNKKATLYSWSDSRPLKKSVGSHLRKGLLAWLCVMSSHNMLPFHPQKLGQRLWSLSSLPRFLEHVACAFSWGVWVEAREKEESVLHCADCAPYDAGKPAVRSLGLSFLTQPLYGGGTHLHAWAWGHVFSPLYWNLCWAEGGVCNQLHQCAVCSVVSNSLWPHWLLPVRLLCP